MRMQIQKSSNDGSQFNLQEFRNNLSKPLKTPSSAAKIKPTENDDEADEDTDQFSLEKLRSFYRMQCEEEMAKIGRNASFQSESPGFIFPSRRASRLSADSATPSSGIPTAVEVEEIGAADGDIVVIVTYSRSPFDDFRRSMQEMVAAARVERKGEVDLAFMEELLLRYLELNNEKYYRYILRAFLELIGVSHEDSGRAPPRRRRRRRWSGGFSRRKLKVEIKTMHKFCCKYRC